jgi:hypothetical protein
MDPLNRAGCQGIRMRRTGKACSNLNSRQPYRDTPDDSPTDPPSTIRILCLYGSVPAKGYWKIEPLYGPHNMINLAAKLHGGHNAEAISSRT